MRYKRYYSLVALVLAIFVTAGCASQATPASPTIEPAAATDVPPQPQAAEVWEVVVEIEVEQPTRMAAFMDGTTGFTGGAGDEGKAHKTTDGGKTWTLIESSKG
jgi:hypothetical protein